MTTILVTAASGHLGRLTVEALLERGVAPADIVATARDTDAVADLAAQGVTIRRLDYGDPASIDFCERTGLDYVSCSPFRVPIARLAAAQAALGAVTAKEG